MAKLKFEAKVWDKAENWFFYTTVYAHDGLMARKELLAMYPKRHYTIVDVRQA